MTRWVRFRQADASEGFTQAVERARVALSSGESDVVRRAELRAAQALLATEDAESKLRPLRWIYRPDKRDNQRRFVDGIIHPAVHLLERVDVNVIT